MHISIGLVALKGRCPAVADAVATVQAFTVMSPDMSLGYIGVADGSLGGAGSASHLLERLHVAIAKEIEGELHAEAPRFLQAGADVEGWWRTVVRDAFRAVDDELVARNDGAAVGFPALIVLALKEYFVLANRGATGAVICRGEEAVQLTSNRTTEPYKKKEKEDEQKEEGHVVRSTSNLEDNTTTSRAISFRPYFPEPEVQIVDLEPQDKFMILGTSGFWAYISPDEACSFIKKKLRMSPSEMLLVNTVNDMRFQSVLANALAEQAIIRGSRSNVTVGVILFKHY